MATPLAERPTSEQRRAALKVLLVAELTATGLTSVLDLLHDVLVDEDHSNGADLRLRTARAALVRASNAAPNVKL